MMLEYVRSVFTVLFNIVGVTSGIALVALCLIYLLVPPRTVTTYITYERIPQSELEGVTKAKEGA